MKNDEQLLTSRTAVVKFRKRRGERKLCIPLHLRSVSGGALGSYEAKRSVYTSAQIMQIRAYRCSNSNSRQPYATQSGLCPIKPMQMSHAFSFCFSFFTLAARLSPHSTDSDPIQLRLHQPRQHRPRLPAANSDDAAEEQLDSGEHRQPSSQTFVRAVV
jgi:hypothetical protein